MDGFINLNKPEGFTSFDCVNKLKKILNVKKIGHAGTLDPDAVGVLPIAVGKATKLLEYVTSDIKTYIAEMTIGIQTDTQDASGETILTVPSSHITEKDLLDIIPTFIGEISQIPPMYSAIKHKGKRLYELARQQIEVERKPRNIKIYELKLLDFLKDEYPKAIIEVKCSKGTYIRTLIEDIGNKLGSTAHMSRLVRNAVGKFKINDAFTIEEIIESLSIPSYKFLLPMDFPLTTLGKIEVEDVEAKKIRHGNAVHISKVRLKQESKNKDFIVCFRGEIIAIANICGELLHVQKVLVSEGEQQ